MTIIEDLAITAEVCGSALMSEAAARIFIAALQGYPEESVHEALTRCRGEITGRLTLAHVLERIDDGRPGPEEAWAMVPKDESASGVVTAEMAEALGVVWQLIKSGDMIQARLAWIEAYRTRMNIARANGVPLTWRLSLGHDTIGREGARLEYERRLGLSAPPERPLIEGPRSDVISALEPIRQIVKDLASKHSIDRIRETADSLEAADAAHSEGRQCATGCDRCMPMPADAQVEPLRIVKRG